MSPDAQAWAETQQRRQREQLARQRAEQERLRQRLIDAQERGRDDQRRQIEREMTALAAEESQRVRNQQRRDEAAQRAQAMMNQVAQVAPQMGPVVFRNTPWEVTPLTEGMPPGGVTTWEEFRTALGGDEPTKADPLGGQAPVPEFEQAVLLSEETPNRRERLRRRVVTGLNAADNAAEQVRMTLGTALQAATDSGLITEQQGLLAMAACGLNASPMNATEVRILLFDLLAQAVRARFLGLSRARTIGRLISEAPKGANEAPGEVPLPEPDGSLDLDVLWALAVRTLPLDASPLTPEGLAAAGPELQTIAREVPALVDRLQALEELVYEALTVYPCHVGHELHLQAPILCQAQMGSMMLDLITSLGIPVRELPRAPHRDQNGERLGCCVRDGRIGTWLVYGQYLNPELKPSRAVRPGKAQPQILDDIAEALAEEGP